MGKDKEEMKQPTHAWTVKNAITKEAWNGLVWKEKNHPSFNLKNQLFYQYFEATLDGSTYFERQPRFRFNRNGWKKW